MTPTTVADDELLTIDETMRITKASRPALAQRRYRRQGPPYIKRGRMILYRRSDIQKWLAAGEVATTDD